MSIKSKASLYNRCTICQGLIRPGDDITWNNEGTSLWHSACEKTKIPKTKPKTKPKTFVPVLTVSEQERLKEFFKYAQV